MTINSEFLEELEFQVRGSVMESLNQQSARMSGSEIDDLVRSKLRELAKRLVAINPL